LLELGRPVQLDARASYDPGVSNSLLGYQWNFGDGTTASGISVTHTYRLPGTYTLTLKVSAPNGATSISKTLTVSGQPLQYANPYIRYLPQNGIPPSNPLVQLPALNSQPVTPPATTPSSSANQSTAILIIVLIIMGIVVLLVLVIVSLLWRSRRPAS
jgi:hypothetical protein